ncbi:MAG: LysR family transcriptional regulator [Gibbsiella quercinecans]|uniref:LysR family transcriptional regulator n=1 Tax=Gibbsiella quercinecans TaxID=929813 RepID=UPI003F378D6A
MDLLTHLRIFIDIADHGSLAAVARARSLAPSAVTASLRRLEAHLGTQLILRSTRHLTFTPEGELFLTQCRRIVRDLDDACDQIADDGPLKGTIRITALNDFGRSRLASVIDSFLKQHPGVRFDLTLDDAVVDLIEGGYDLGIRTGPLSDSRLKARLILRSGRSICAAPAYWQRWGKPARPEELVHHNCLVLSRIGNPQTIWRFNDGTETLSVAVSGDRTADDGGLLRRWAVSGAGVVLKSDYDIADDLKAGRLETALDEFKQNDVNLYVVHAAAQYLPRRARAFIEHLATEGNSDTTETAP